MRRWRRTAGFIWRDIAGWQGERCAGSWNGRDTGICCCGRTGVEFGKLLHQDEPPLINIGTGGDLSIREIAETVCQVVEFEGELGLRLRRGGRRRHPMLNMRTCDMRKRSHLRLAAALGLVLAWTLAGLAAYGQQTAAQRIFALTNQDRVAQGLQTLAWNAALARSAEAHAEKMADEPTLSHDYPGEPGLLERAAQAGAHFQAIAENIASGWSAGQIENAWMHSTPHRKNILDPKLNALGVGVVRRGGKLYAVEDFAEADQALDAGQVERKVRVLLQAGGVDASMAAGPAEEACRMWRGIPPGSSAKSIVRFETPDLSRLPGQIAAAIRSAKFTKAAVGACAPPSGEDFTTYRVAILFY